MKTKLKMLVSIMMLTFSYEGKSATSIEEALKKGWVKAVTLGRGGHAGDVVQMKVQNISANELEIEVEAGRRLDSEDSLEQDLLIVKTEIFALAPKKNKLLKLFGYCCQAHNSSPDSGDVFSIGKIADEKLMKLAKFIDENKWYEKDFTQDAVWAISDGNPLEGIWSQDSVATKKMLAFVSQLTGKPIPKYRIKYEDSDGSGAAFSGKPAEISGIFEYELFREGVITFGIYNVLGKCLVPFFVDQPRRKGQYTFNYKYKTSNLPSGKYFAKMYADGQLIKEMEFNF